MFMDVLQVVILHASSPIVGNRAIIVTLRAFAAAGEVCSAAWGLYHGLSCALQVGGVGLGV